MITELAKHIGRLLAENDCVILPGFGGFIVQYVPSRREDGEGMFLPPCRTVGFNRRLTLNDGLLVQSYMQAYDTGYPKASLLVEEAVADLRTLLSERGEADMPGVGRLVLNIENGIDFYPDEAGLFSPALYGLGSFEMSELDRETGRPAGKRLRADRSPLHVPPLRLRGAWVNYVVAGAAAVLLFFFLSTPVDNTYVEPESYASLGSENLFNVIRSQQLSSAGPKEAEKAPLAAEPAVQPEEEQRPATAVQPESEHPAVSPSAEVKTPARRKQYHIIVASVTNREDAEKTIRFFADKGFPGGKAVEGDGRVRIALATFSERDAAEAKLTELRETELLRNAWILPARIQ